MRDQLIQYVDLLFAGAADCEDIKQEILQNTLDRYDDLIDEGKVPQAAYRLAITGIGDLSEILGAGTPAPVPGASPVSRHEEEPDTPRKKLMRAIAIGLYITCPIPLFLTESVLSLCVLLLIVAVATVLIILGSRKDDEEEEQEAHRKEADPLRKSIETVLWAIGIALYFIVSFTTGAWHITWVIFLLNGAVKGLIKAILDLKEASNHEN